MFNRISLWCSLIAFLSAVLASFPLTAQTWTEHNNKVRPPARMAHAMAYDSVRQRVVLFGGQLFSTLWDDETWEYGFAATTAAAGTARPGGTVSLVLTAASDAGLFYQAGSSLGTGPIPVGNRRIGLSPDALLQVSAGDLWPWIFKDYRGTLDQRGQAAATIHIPNASVLVGTRIHTAFVTTDPKAPWGIRSISATITTRDATPQTLHLAGDEKRPVEIGHR